MLNECIHNMSLVATLETQEEILSKSASEYVADVNSNHVLSARPRFSNRAAVENGCCAEEAKSQQRAQDSEIWSDFSTYDNEAWEARRSRTRWEGEVEIG
jgi:hypothetical protein